MFVGVVGIGYGVEVVFIEGKVVFYFCGFFVIGEFFIGNCICADFVY